uniref:AAA+ ATPase domain-containing protein n=1 Tax=Dunaliella tertiolecta TaxID=3047 RepID=A0A7S3R134_DUNTE
MPLPGPPASLHSKALEDPGSVGYHAVLAQIYQAYEQRLPKTAKEELRHKGYVSPGKHIYSCPGDGLLDVSWHETEAAPLHPLTRFLTSPSLSEAMGWIQHGINSTNIFDARMMRDRFMSLYGPEPVQLNIQFDPNNAGPLYFFVCLTLGIIIPALRRNRILDISTLEEDPGAAQEFARSKSTARKEGLTGVEFGDVAGIGPILSEIMEVVEFLKDPKTFGKLGARPPKGMLLEGDPGTGKTLLAKALAGEAMVPFYQMAGTEFVEGIIGLGAARVRDLFKRARANAPCVIFVDEIDALGLKRAEGDGTGKVNEEREQTLNQLLTEMDGFTPDTGVVFIGATNRADLLDPALMRPGRFDRKVRMPKPDTNGRYEILQLHLRKKQVDPGVDLLQLARDLPGLAGADLANIVNEAQLNAVRAGRQAITAKDMYAGVDRFTQGERRPPLPTTHKLPILTFSAKEAGVALVASLLRKKHGRIEPVERASVQPKGRSYSRTLFARGTDEDYQVMTRGRLLDRIKVALAGHVAVRIVLGQETNTSQPDIQRACHMAHKFVFYYGMSEIGLTTWAMQPYSGDFLLGSNKPRKVVSTDAMDEYADWPTRNEDFRFDPPDPSDVTWHRYTDEVRRVVKMCYEDVWAMLQEHKPALQATVDALSENGELLGGELRDIFDANPPEGPYDPSVVPPVLRDMVLFTEKSEGKDVWPYGIDWLDAAYSTPYFVTKQAEERAAQEAKAGV